MTQPVSEQFRLAAKEWVELDSAASLLEETKSSILSQRMMALGEIPVSRAEMTVKASEEWHSYIKEMVAAREKANYAKVKLEWVRMRYGEQQSAEATARAEARL